MSKLDDEDVSHKARIVWNDGHTFWKALAMIIKEWINAPRAQSISEER